MIKLSPVARTMNGLTDVVMIIRQTVFLFLSKSLRRLPIYAILVAAAVRTKGVICLAKEDFLQDLLDCDYLCLLVLQCLRRGEQQSGDYR